jgi:hypothetical protein
LLHIATLFSGICSFCFHFRFFWFLGRSVAYDNPPRIKYLTLTHVSTNNLS